MFSVRIDMCDTSKLFSINYAAALIANSDMEGAVSAYLRVLQCNPVGSLENILNFIFNNYFYRIYTVFETILEIY